MRFAVAALATSGRGLRCQELVERSQGFWDSGIEKMCPVARKVRKLLNDGWAVQARRRTCAVASAGHSPYLIWLGEALHSNGLDAKGRWVT